MDKCTLAQKHRGHVIVSLIRLLEPPLVLTESGCESVKGGLHRDLYSIYFPACLSFASHMPAE